MPRKTAAAQAAKNDLEKTVGAQDPQTDPDNEEGAQKAPGIQAGEGENMASPQTGIENEPDEGSNTSQTRTPGSAADSDTPFSQTGTETTEDSPGPVAQQEIPSDTPPHSQTEFDPKQNLAEFNRSAGSEDETSPDSQTDPENTSYRRSSTLKYGEIANHAVPIDFGKGFGVLFRILDKQAPASGQGQPLLCAVIFRGRGGARQTKATDNITVTAK